MEIIICLSNGQRIFKIGNIQSWDCNAAGRKINCYKFSGGQFGYLYIEPTIPFVELYNEEVIGQEQIDMCTSRFSRGLVLMKNGNNCKYLLIEYWMNL